MRLNDKLMTTATAMVLAMSAGAAGIFLGGDNNGTGAVEVASLDPKLSLPQNKTNAGIYMNSATKIDETQSFRSSMIRPSSKPEDVEASAEPKPAQKTAALKPLVLTTPTNQEMAAGVCNLEVDAKPLVGARVTLSVSAPCHPNVTTTIEHAGFRFKEKLDADGKLALKVPVFAEYSEFKIALSDGATKNIGTYVAGVSDVERIGLSSKGGHANLIAQESSAFERREVSAKSPGSFTETQVTAGGFFTLLGDPSLKDAAVVQVYSLQKSPRNAGQIVALSVEAGCGAGAINLTQLSHVAGLLKSEVLVSKNACKATKQTLVLKNIVKDLKLAKK